MLSPLARGYGSWTGDIDLCQSNSNTNDSFPTVGYPDPHRHGVTVSPRSHVGTPGTAQSSHRARFESTDSGKIPKTFLTRKGALLLFTAPDTELKGVNDGVRTVQNHRKGKKLLDLSLKLGTLDRLCRSVLQYGDEAYDRENSSVTDPRNRLFLKFIHQTSELDDGQFDVHSQPGGDLGFYLRDLKTRASSRMYSEGDPRSRTRSPELRNLLKDLDGALPLHRRSATCTDFTQSPRGSPKQRVLSSRKLAASIKSSTYLGRPASTVSLAETSNPESAANLPCITPQSSAKSRSRTSSKSGLWVQGYDKKPQTESKAPTKPSSAKSRPSQRANSKVENLKTKDGGEATLLTEEDSTSAAEEQDIVLPSDGEEEEGEGFPPEEDMWPAVDDGEGDVEGDQVTLQMTQPLKPPYNVGGLVEDLEVAVDKDGDGNLIDGQEEEKLVDGQEMKLTDGQEKRDTDSIPDDQEAVHQEADLRQTEGVQDQSEHDDDNKESAAETPESDFIFKDGTETSGITTPESALQGKPEQVPEATEDVPEQRSLHSSESPEQALADSRQSPLGTEAEEQFVEDGSGPPADESQGPSQGIASGSPQGLDADPALESGSANASPNDLGLAKATNEPAFGISKDPASKSTKPPTEGLSVAAAPAAPAAVKSWSPASATEHVSPTPSVKSRVTFDENVTTQSIPKTPPQPTKQPQPPKTKPTSRPTPKARVPAKGGNQKTGKTTKSFVKAMDITSVQPDEEKMDEAEAPPEKKARQKLAPSRHVETKSDKTKSSVLPSHMEELLNRRSTSKSQEELELEMAQMSEVIESTLAGPTLSVDTGEGLTEEELKLAREALSERVKQATSQIDDVANREVKKPTRQVKAADSKSRKKKNVAVEEKRNIQEEQAAIREQRKREKLERLEEAKALQEKIRAREAERRAKEEEAKRKAQQLAEDIAELKREEHEIQQAEEDARRQLALARKSEREVREKRRKEDLERKKQEAIRRREKEKKMAEAARQKEEEMLRRIADNEMKRSLQEEELRKREEEERIAQEQYEEELKQAQREAEEEELRMRELEKEAEEEAMQRLIEEREEAERRRWKLNELARQMEEEEARKRQVLVEEEEKLEAEKKRREEEEQQKLEDERRRLQELEHMEAEARMTMRLELMKRKEWAQKRREANLERRENLDNTRHGQGITRAWVFSYFPDWPLDSYNKLMGEDAKSKKGFRPKPKPKPKEPSDPQPEAEQPSGETT